MTKDMGKEMRIRVSIARYQMMESASSDHKKLHCEKRERRKE